MAGCGRSAGLALTLVALAVAASGCATPTSDAAVDGRLTVVASTNVYADIARAITGHDADVSVYISSPSQDPHSYVASARDILTMSHADVVIENGGGYDDFIDQLLESAPGDPTVVNAVDVSGVTAPSGGELNEHVWYDVAAMRTLALDLGRVFGEADPAHRAAYRHNAAGYAARLTGLLAQERRLRHLVAGDGVAVTEPLPGYLIDALGLVNRTPPAFADAVESGDEVSVSVMHETLGLFTDDQVGLLFDNEQTVGPVTTQVTDAAEASGIPVVHLTETLPDGETYLGLITATLDETAAALGARR
jgi:zinc/manganese transport system substrate-binding protein